jgi:hypothetical protein
MRLKIRKKEKEGREASFKSDQSDREIPVGERLQEVTIYKARKVLESA